MNGSDRLAAEIAALRRRVAELETRERPAMPTAAQVGVAQTRARVDKQTNQTAIPANTFVKVTWTHVLEDTDSIVDLANSRITPLAGTYLFVASLTWQWNADRDEGTLFVGYFYRNGTLESTFPLGGWPSSSLQFLTLSHSIVVQANGTDEFEMYAIQLADPARVIDIYGDDANTFTSWQIVRLA